MYRQYRSRIDSFIPRTCEYGNHSKLRGPVIVRPVGISACGGKGVEVYASASEVKIESRPEWTWIVSEYITNPLLFDGYKFHLRMHVVVTSNAKTIIPRGKILIAADKYTSQYLDKNQSDTHTASTPRQYIFPEHAVEKFGYNSTLKLIAGCRKIFDYTLPHVVIKSQPESDDCYAVLGYDIIFDTNYNAWLIEINNCVGYGNCEPDNPAHLKWTSMIVLYWCDAIVGKTTKPPTVVGNTATLIKYYPIVPGQYDGARFECDDEYIYVTADYGLENYVNCY